MEEASPNDSKSADERVMYALHPDHTWPDRANHINDALLAMLDVCNEMKLSLCNETERSDNPMKDYLQSVHFLTCQAMAFLNTRDADTLLAITRSNHEGELFRRFMN